MKTIVKDSSVNMLMFYIVMNNLFEIKSTGASLIAKNFVSTENTGE
jgi:hypothetical protein